MDAATSVGRGLVAIPGRDRRLPLHRGDRPRRRAAVHGRVIFQGDREKLQKAGGLQCRVRIETFDGTAALLDFLSGVPEVTVEGAEGGTVEIVVPAPAAEVGSSLAA